MVRIRFIFVEILMEPNIFNLDFSRWPIVLLSLVPAFINIVIYIYTNFFIPASRINSSFSFFVLLTSIWQFGEAFIKLGITPECALEWNKISVLFLVFMIPQGLKFTFYLLQWHKNRLVKMINIFMFLSAFFFSVLIVTRQDQYSIVKSDSWYWIVNPSATLVTSLILIWICTGAVLMLTLVWINFFKSQKNTLARKQSFLIAIGLIIPVVLGVILEAIFPLILAIDDVPLTAPVMTFFSLASVIAIKKFKLLQYSPKHQWSSIIKSLHDGLVICDNDGKIMYANQRFCELVQYTFIELKDQEWFTFLVTDGIDRKQYEKIKEERQNKRSGQYEVKLRTKSGEYRWLMVSGSPYFGDKGNVIGSIGVLADLTKSKEAESAVIYAEKRLREAQEIAHVGSWELNFSTNKGVWSDEACRIYGICPTKKAEQSFQSWMSFIHPSDIDLVKTEVEKSKIAFTSSSFKHRIVRADGSVRHIQTISRYEVNDIGYPVGLVGICVDITEQTEAEKALAKTEIRMRTFINESLLAIFFIDPVTRKIVYANSTFLDMLGYRQNEFESVDIYQFIHHSRENIDERISGLIRDKKIPNSERTWQKKDGSLINVLVSTIYEDTDTPLIYVAAQDITERKTAEEKLKQINKELEVFIYKTGHDIRGPLASILGLVNVAKLELDDIRSLKYIDMVESAAKKLDYTLGELMKAMKIKGVDLFEDRIDFNALIPHVLSKYQHFPGVENIKISFNVNFRDILISNNSVLETIIQNLVENAIKYRNTTICNSYLDITVNSNNEVLLLNFEDNGIGIDKAIRENIFDMYFRGTDSSSGSGLGLYLVNKGVEKLKGRIRVESVPKKGTAFTITIPLGNPQGSKLLN